MASGTDSQNVSKITVVSSDEVSSLFPSKETSDEMVALYSEMFKDRYTEDDAAYVENKSRPIASPPCVTNWYTKPRRSYDWSRQGRQNPDFRERDSGRPFYAGQRQQYDQQRQDRSYHPYHRGNQHNQYNQRGRGYQQQQQGHYQNYNRY